MSVAQNVDLQSLSVEQLKALRQRWYEDARKNGSIAAICRVVRELGTRYPKKHGNYLEWIGTDGVRIGFDDWTGALWVWNRDRLVFSSNAPGLFVPGPWMDAVRAADLTARRLMAEGSESVAEAERQALIRQLGGA